MPEHDSRPLDGFQRLAVATPVTSLVLIALGGLVRGTDNGLACPDWPKCYGEWLPGRADLPEGLTLVNVWIEHSHRGAAAILGGMVVVLVVWALLRYRRPSILVPAVGILAAVGIQAWLGRQVVLGLLAADTVTAHLALGMAILAFLIYLTVTVSLPRPRRAATRGRDLRLARTSLAVAALGYVQILVGGHVTGIGAGLAFTDFPLFGGALLPAIGSEQEAFHVAHRLLAYALAVGVVMLAVRSRAAVREGHLSHRGWLPRLPWIAVALVTVQIGLGVANLSNGTSPWTVVPHLAVASWIWAVLALTTILAYRRATGSSPPGHGTGAVVLAKGAGREERVGAGGPR